MELNADIVDYILICDVLTTSDDCHICWTKCLPSFLQTFAYNWRPHTYQFRPNFLEVGIHPFRDGNRHPSQTVDFTFLVKTLSKFFIFLFSMPDNSKAGLGKENLADFAVHPKGKVFETWSWDSHRNAYAFICV